MTTKKTTTRTKNLDTAGAIEDFTEAGCGRATSKSGTAKQRAATSDDGYRKLAKLHIPIALTEAERTTVDAPWLLKMSRYVNDGFGAQNNAKATRWAKGERK